MTCYQNLNWGLFRPPASGMLPPVEAVAATTSVFTEYSSVRKARNLYLLIYTGTLRTLA